MFCPISLSELGLSLSKLHISESKLETWYFDRCLASQYPTSALLEPFFIEGLAVDAKSVQTTSDPAHAEARAKALTGMMQDLKRNKPAAYQAYNAMKSNVDKQARLADYLVDPEKCNCSANNFTQRTSSSKTRDREVWLTEDQLASSNWMNNASHAEAYCKTALSRKHKDPALAALNVMQYQYFYHVKDDTNLTERRYFLLPTALSSAGSSMTPVLHSNFACIISVSAIRYWCSNWPE